jgi:TolB protein
MRTLGRCLLATALLSLALAGPAGATFPGENGRISFWRFLPQGGGGISIFTVRSDGSGLRQVTTFGAGVFSTLSDWSPDGDKLAFESDNGGSSQIWIVNPHDASPARRLTDIAGDAFDPAWAPDGRTLAIGSAFEDPPGTFLPGIFLIPARARNGGLVTGAQARRVTSVSDGGYDSEPQVSPDGRWIVFTRYSVECTDDATFANCETRIFRVRTNGRNLQQLTAAAVNASAPDFHPSGRWIAFDTHDNFVAPNAGNIVVMRPDGSEKHIIVRADDNDFFNNPSFSPDGRKVAFARWGAADPNPVSRIWTARADGANPHQTVAPPADPSEADNKPDWGSVDRHHHHGGD